jgi:tetratricopeptide (TPR) repeat protein
VGNRKSFPKFAGMKAMPFVIGFLFALVACTEKTQVPEPAVAEHGRSVEGPTIIKGPSPELSAIDSLMWHQPDSALMRLLPYFNDTCRDVACNVYSEDNNGNMEDVARYVSTNTAYNRHYAHLLLAELLYKNDYAQTNRTELLQAVTYFDSLVRQAPPLKGGRGDSPPLKGGARRAGDSKTTSNPISNLAFLDARAHYINGVGYYEQDSLIQACAEYLKTLEVMESHFNENELVGHKARFMAYTYNRLGYMFEEQLLAEPAIVCYKQSLCYCKRESTSIYGIPIILYKLGIQFDIAGRKDSAAIYYDKALAYMPDHDNIHYRDIMVNKALLAYNTGFCIDSVIKDLKYVVSLASDEEEKITRFLTIGNILFEEKHYDSARFYLETVFEQQEDIQSKILAAVNLCDIYLSEGDSVKARQYTSFLSGYTMKEIEKKTDVSKINEMFQDYLKQKQEKLSEKERENSIRKTIGIIVPIAIAVVLAIIIIAKLRGKKLLRDKEIHHRQEMEAKEALSRKELEERDKRHAEAIETERQTHRMEQAAMSGRLKRSNQEVRELKDQIKQQSNTAAKTGQAVSFMDEPICRLIMERVNEGQFKSQMDCTLYKDYALGKEQMTALREATDRHFGQFTVRLKKAYPELTHGDLDYCCLYLLGLSDADISALMQRAYNTVNERNSKLRRIFGSENAISITLQAIANESISI